MTTQHAPTRTVARIALAVAAVVTTSGCGRSALIPTNDLTYRRSIANLVRTRQLITASLAPAEDEAMFLQAESLFRYRFASPGRSAGAYVAQIGASIIDLPVLASLAGSLGQVSFFV